jgi:small subunit ribosomal protein S14
MAKTSVVLRNKKREKMVLKFAARRAELKRRAKDMSQPPEARMAAREALAALPRNSSPIRVRNRCMLTGRPRGVYRKFMINRMAFREMAHMGYLPGIHKASW